MKIVAITIIEQRHGPDIVSLRTDLPEGLYPYKDTMCLEFRCAKGSGVRYVIQHFPDIVIEHIAQQPQNEVWFGHDEGDDA